MNNEGQDLVQQFNEAHRNTSRRRFANRMLAMFLGLLVACFGGGFMVSLAETAASAELPPPAETQVICPPATFLVVGDCGVVVAHSTDPRCQM